MGIVLGMVLGLIAGAVCTCLVVFATLLLGAATYKPFKNLIDRLCDWADRIAG